MLYIDSKMVRMKLSSPAGLGDISVNGRSTVTSLENKSGNISKKADVNIFV